MYRDLNKVKIKFAIAQKNGIQMNQDKSTRIEPVLVSSPPQIRKYEMVYSDKKAKLQKNPELKLNVEPGPKLSYILKRLNSFNLGKLTDDKDVYDFYSFSELPSTIIQSMTTRPSIEGSGSLPNQQIINPLMQFINGLTLISISFLKLPQSKILLTNMMYKLGDNKCVEFIENSEIILLKGYLRENIFSNVKRTLDVEVFFWVLWSNFKRKIQNIEIQEQREALFDELRIFGFKSEFFKLIQTLKPGHIKGETPQKKFDDSDIYNLVKSLLDHSSVSNCFGFLFKLAINELKLPASLYSKVKIGQNPTQNYTLYQNYMFQQEELSSKLAIILVEVSKEGNTSEKEIILAFGASMNQSFTVSQIQNNFDMTQPIQSYSPGKQLEISAIDIMQGRNFSQHDTTIVSDSPILTENLNQVSKILSSPDSNQIEQKTFLDSLPVVEETSQADEEHSSQMIEVDQIQLEGVRKQLDFDLKDNDSLRFDEEDSVKCQSNGSDLVEIEVERVIHNIDQFENLPGDQDVTEALTPTSIDSLNKISQKNEELQKLLRKNAKSVRKLNKRVWDTTSFMDKINSYMSTVDQNSRIVNLSLKSQSYNSSKFMKKGKMDYLFNRGNIMKSKLSNSRVNKITPIYSNQNVAGNNAGPFLKNFNLSNKLY